MASVAVEVDHAASWPPFHPASGFYRRDGARVICAVCLREVHDEQCPVVIIHQQLRELAAHMGAFVAETRDTMETIEALLRAR
jgi:hypothetical protein